MKSSRPFESVVIEFLRRSSSQPGTPSAPHQPQWASANASPPRASRPLVLLDFLATSGIMQVLEGDPMPHLSPPTLTHSEQRAILRATACNPRDHLVYSLALGTGLRLAEIVGLAVGDVYIDDRIPGLA